MKKLSISIFVMSLLISLLFVRCEKDSPYINPIAEVSSNRSTINYNESDTITLVVKNAVLINSDLPGFNNVEVLETIKSFNLVTPKLITTTTYTFTIYGENETHCNASLTITVKPAPSPPKCVITFTPAQIQYSGIATINISSTDANSLVTDLPGVTGISGVFQTPVLSETTWYHFTFTGEGGTTKDSLQIVVIQPSLHVQMLTAHSWRAESSRESYTSGEGPWTPTNIDYTTPCMLDNNYAFSLDGTVVWSQGELCGSGGVIADPMIYNWTLSGDSLFQGGNVIVTYWGFDKIVWFQKSESSYWDGTQWISVDWWFEETLTNPTSQ